MGNVHSSAGVYTSEKDLSQRIAAASTSIGAIVGASKKGPIMERTLITGGAPQFLSIFGQPDPAVSYMHFAALEFLKEAGRMYVTRVAQQDALTAGAYVTVDDINATTPIIKITNFDNGSNVPLGLWDPFNTVSFDPLQPGTENILGFFCAANPGEWNNDLFIQMRPSNKIGVALPDDPYVFHVDVYLNYKSPRQQPNESFLVSRDYRTDGFNRQMNIEDVINGRSNLIRYMANPNAVKTIKVLGVSAEFLNGATNGTLPTTGMIIQGWDLYTDPERVDVNILINGGYTDVDIQMRMDAIARSRMDAIAVLDVPSDQQEVAAAMNFMLNELNNDTSYSAMYSPDLLIYDVHSDRNIYIPPSGHVAACYAKTDNDYAAWFAPAGMSRGSLDIRGVRNVYNQTMRDALDSVHINPIRSIPGKGYKVWGADTMQAQASALSNVHVRRLLNFLEKSIGLAALHSVFAPNDPILWAQLVEMCERFLKPIKEARGLYWFHVQCDEFNNTPEVIANGDTMLDVFLDPTMMAKRIHLNAIVNKTGQTYKEATQDR